MAKYITSKEFNITMREVSKDLRAITKSHYETREKFPQSTYIITGFLTAPDAIEFASKHNVKVIAPSIYPVVK
jgi:hypothetical protein